MDLLATQGVNFVLIFVLESKQLCHWNLRLPTHGFCIIPSKGTWASSFKYASINLIGTGYGFYTIKTYAFRGKMCIAW